MILLSLLGGVCQIKSSNSSPKWKPGCPLSEMCLPRRCRVLALDGGGIKGAYTASVLHTFEQMSGKRICDHFDLIVGTSTGGIIAIGIGLGLEMQQILDMYASRGPFIFPPSFQLPFLPQPLGLFRTKYRADGLKKEIEHTFGESKLGASQCRLVITALNADDGDVKLFKTAHHDRFKRDYKYRASDIALSTSAAPTFFPAHGMNGGYTLVDGGVWANCPALVGAIEAMTVLGHKREDIDILSVGTTQTPFHIPRRRRVGGKARWAMHAADMLMHAGAAGAVAQAELLTRRKERWDGLLRINAMVLPKRFSLDSSKEVDALVALGQKSAEHNAELVDGRFLTKPAPKFVPIYSD